MNATGNASNMEVAFFFGAHCADTVRLYNAVQAFASAHNVATHIDYESGSIVGMVIMTNAPMMS